MQPYDPLRNFYRRPSGTEQGGPHVCVFHRGHCQLRLGSLHTSKASDAKGEGTEEKECWLGLVVTEAWGRGLWTWVTVTGTRILQEPGVPYSSQQPGPLVFG